MYIQITNRCQMSCPHCCFSCTLKGENMTMKTFRKALELGDECLTIGGGEPTLHPEFERFLFEAIASPYVTDIFIVTNGGITKRALMLARLTKKGIVDAKLSQDEYHDSIDNDVIDAFEGRYWDITKEGTVEPKPVGRAAELLGYDEDQYTDDDGKDNCACSDIFVCPNGTIKQCGCGNSKIIGNVKDGWDSPCPGECFNGSYYKKEMRILQEEAEELLEVA